MKYFGTDGIRFLTKELNKKLLSKLSKAIVLFYKKNKLKPILLIGNDSRISSDYILSELCSVLLKNGIEVHNLGVCSSPCLAYVAKNQAYPLSLMISASHNPAEYNGLKFFNANGEKVDDTFEQNIESLMEKPLKNLNKFTNLKNVECLKKDYILKLKNLIKFNFPCIFDCANGGVSHICKHLFPQQVKININPDGNNINNNAGCTHIEMLKTLCTKQQKIGFAFDGDADRVFAVSENGNILTGDEILFILSKFYLKENSSLVGTIYTNTGLEKHLKTRQITLIRTAVGDKNILIEMNAKNFTLGGEESGHIIIKPFTNTGDGLLVAILLANIVQTTKKSFDELLKDYKKHTQLRANLKLKTEYKPTPEIEEFISTAQKNNVKIIIRPSGTEPLLRLFVESENPHTATQTLTQLKQFFE